MKKSTHERERLAREQDMLDAAVKLFCENGFEKTSMEDLAKESEYTKKTIYRYFTCKEDLFFAVILQGNRTLSDMIAKSYNSDNNGLENIRCAYSAFYNFYCENNQLLQLMAMVGMVKSRSADKEVPFREKCDEQTTTIFKNIADLFFLAKADGSIRPDLDVNVLAYSSVFMTTGFFNQFSLSGDSFTRFIKMDRELFVSFCIDRMIDSLLLA